MSGHRASFPGYKNTFLNKFFTPKLLPMLLSNTSLLQRFLKKSITRNSLLLALCISLFPFAETMSQAWSPNPAITNAFNLPANQTFRLGRATIGRNLFSAFPNNSQLEVFGGALAQVQTGIYGSFSTATSNTWSGLGQNPVNSVYGLGLFKTNKFAFFNLEDVTRTTATKDLIVGFGSVAGTNADQRMVFRNFTTTGANNAPLATRDILSLNPNGSVGVNDINPISTMFVNAVNSNSGFKSVFLLNEGSVANFPLATFSAIGQEGNSTVNAPIFGFRAQLGSATSTLGRIATNLQVTGIPAAPVANNTQEVELTFQDLSTTTPVANVNRFNATSFDRLGVFFRNGTNNPADKKRVLAIMANGTVGVNTGAANPITNLAFTLPFIGTLNFPVDLHVPNGGILTSANYIFSDKKFKTNILTIVDPIAKIKRLRGTTFTFSPTGSEKDAIPSYGFIAQEVQEVLPELTGMSEDQTMAVNYDGIIPLLVEGVKVIAERTGVTGRQMEELTAENTRLKTQMDEMSTWIAEVSARLNIAPPPGVKPAVTAATNAGRPADEVNPAAPNGTRLLQNRPNPTNGFTEIFYDIKDNGTAALTISDQQGRIRKTYNNLAQGQGKVVVNKGDLQAGTYTYTLTINGKLISSRQMVIL
jgi:Chaperone of endosialidase